jgi:hypothetical protein
MSKKKKSPPNLSIQDIEYQAIQQLENGNYKEAIDSYKQLLKQEEREVWRTALATAYLERAKSLANKEMYKEAAVLWENRATFCNDQNALDLYIFWLIRGGRHIRAARLYRELQAQLATSEFNHSLLIWFALLLLTHHEEVAEFFPEETPLYQHYQIINSALQAYCQGDDVGLETGLKQISFRSPYRDFRFILKALVAFEREPQSVHQILAQIAADSPFSQFAQLIQAMVNPSDQLWDILTQVSPPELTLLANFKGWDKTHLKSVLNLRLAVKKANSKITFGTILTHRHLLGNQYSQKLCLALLPDYLAGLKDYQKTFGNLSLFEQERITALAEERRKRFDLAEKNWRKCISVLKRSVQDGDNALKIALILRHLVNLGKRYSEEENADLILRDLEESLTFDPTDKASYIELITAYQVREDDKNYQKWVESAISQFPQDTEILMMAIAAARHRKAFKKASKFANGLLQIDPINVKARHILLSSHLAHAYKLIKNSKFDLARKELIQAAALERENQRGGLVTIVQGLLEWKNEQTELAIKLLAEGIQYAGNNLKGYLYLLVEAKRLNIEVEPILKSLPFFKKSRLKIPFLKPKFPLPERQDVMSLVTALNSYQEDGINFLFSILEQLQSSLEKAKYAEFSQDELTLICQCFEKIPYYPLLKKYASQALKRWPNTPIFVYYQIYAIVKGKSTTLSDSHFELLEQTLERARRDGDKRAAMLIADFLMQSFNMKQFFDELRETDDHDEVDEKQIKKLIEQLKKAGLELPDPFDNPPQGRNRKK